MEAVEDGAAPDPRRIVDPAGFIEDLNRLREHAGSPPYRALAQQVGALLRAPRQVPYRTVADDYALANHAQHPDNV